MTTTPGPVISVSPRVGGDVLDVTERGGHSGVGPSGVLLQRIELGGKFVPVGRDFFGIGLGAANQIGEPGAFGDLELVLLGGSLRRGDHQTGYQADGKYTDVPDGS